MPHGVLQCLQGSQAQHQAADQHPGQHVMPRIGAQFQPNQSLITAGMQDAEQPDDVSFPELYNIELCNADRLFADRRMHAKCTNVEGISLNKLRAG